MNNYWFFALAPLSAALWQVGVPNNGAPACRAHLESRLDGNQLTLVGYCQNSGAQPLTLRYELLTDKKGRSGTATNSQSGSFSVAAQQTTTLSKTTITIVPADFCRVKLRLLTSQGIVVSEDSLVHHPITQP
ncbi:curli-like amyloid fiber formation chaperone CsgH [Hymenobacter elongatus]|uniref:Curli assembly protein CsgC n=1 Tax=Hymenobacter elongatus TaxID=877208 RepID=A0A4Z0PS39_9BACT|nr:curli-like amyloid fiber formation chaperone CsgH [Hymenobacter elongatus]TGE18632.1 hypothetical protein E5J99_04825 [Hymenobacter elongatus]